MVVHYRCCFVPSKIFFLGGGGGLLNTKCGLLVSRDAPVGVGSLRCLFSDLLKCQIFPLVDSNYLFVYTFTFSNYTSFYYSI